MVLIRHKTWLTGTQRKSSLEDQLKWFWVDLIMNFTWTSCHQNDSQEPLFVIETSNIFTWLTVIHYNSCLLGRLFSM